LIKVEPDGPSPVVLFNNTLGTVYNLKKVNQQNFKIVDRGDLSNVYQQISGIIGVIIIIIIIII